MVCSIQINKNRNKTYVNLLVWAELNETGGDLLCTKLTEKISSPHGVKLALGHFPIIIACLKGIRRHERVSDGQEEKKATVLRGSVVCQKVGAELGSQCVQYLASPSNRLYEVEISGGEGALIAINRVMVLGKIVILPSP